MKMGSTNYFFSFKAILKKNIYYLILNLIIFLFASCSSEKNDENSVTLIKPVGGLGLEQKHTFNRDSLLKEITVLLDSAKQYLTLDDKKRQFWIDTALLVTEKHRLWNEYIEIKINHQLTHLIYYNKTIDWKRELLLIDSLIELHKDELRDKANMLTIQCQTQWGIYYSQLGFDLLALNIFKKSIKILSQVPKDSVSQVDLYHNYRWTASIYKKIGSYQKSIQESLQSLVIYNNIRDSLQPPDLSGIYCELAESYLKTGETTNAFQYYIKAKDSLATFLDTTSTPQIWNSNLKNVYLGLAQYYNTTNQFDKSLQALLDIQAYLQLKDPFIARNLIAIGDIYLNKKEYKKTLELYLKAKEINCNQYGYKNYRVANTNIKTAQLFEKQNEWQSALSYYQQAICNVTLDFNDSLNYWSNLDHIAPNQIIGRTELLKALAGKTNALSKLYTDKREIKYLMNAQQANNLSIALIDSIKNDLFLDKDRQFQIADHYPIYEKGIAIAEQIFDLTKDGKQFEKIVTLSEQSKSLSLLAVFQSALIENSETIPVIERERQLKYEIAKREETLISQRKPLNEDSQYLALQLQLHKWIDEIKEKNPAYLKFKYNTPIASVQTIQKRLISHNQALIEYFWGENYLFTIAISSEKVSVHKQEIGSLPDSIRLLRALAINPGWRTKIDTSIHFQMLSHYLYEKLMKVPLQELGNHYDKLLIVRDGPLEYIPFELLDVSAQTTPGILSKDDFLLSHYTLAYANSASLLQLQSQYKKREAGELFAGFAPSYEGLPDTTDNLPLAHLTLSGQIELKATKSEVETIVKTIGGDPYTDIQATEKKFKEQASNYKILHMAMHALANDQQPELSELLFSYPNPDSTEDGRLRAIELYNMRLNAEMVVLSACVTGYGRLQRGEGVLSIGHAFTYAGTPSIVASHWNAHDSSTGIIMKTFYANLKKGMPKDEALTEAKRNFLETTPPELAHPFFWATFGASGDMSSIQIPTSIFSYLFFIAILFLIAFIFRKGLSSLLAQLRKVFQKKITSTI